MNKNESTCGHKSTPYLIEFLYEHFFGSQGASRWHDQTSEGLADKGNWLNKVETIYEPKVVRLPRALSTIERSRELCQAIQAGAIDKLVSFQDRHKFIVIVGAPRSGGSYLTKVLFSALGKDVNKVSATIAHDGFPELAPFFMAKGFNVHTIMAQRMGEYLAMVELYFEKSAPRGSRVIVPKKASKAAYQGAFLNSVLGNATEYIVTVRHPIPSCVSTYEKSGGLPEHGKFATRSAIEIWAARDYLFTAGDGEAAGLLNKDYFDVYLRFWEQYHYSLALSGLSANKNWTVVPYTETAMMEAARGINERFNAGEHAERFVAFDKRSRHPEWHEAAERAVERVRDVWASVGLAFPFEEIMQSW
ncbi:hypothetical protein [Thiobacillus sp.]|uniref:hypothetical protein n=1 Tax=Thiobacillus sp. TaxID=924 RepID=UPI0017C1B665|nr:hypothetical protein [Thiobacillus sp.]MBC2732575.1 hypothetical protein [Thiobacillus sp.]MBC2741312.1 hypothetical protein [Thiobacillus sp.]